MSDRPMRIVIAGGGSAGWMCAAALIHLLGDGFAVTLVESDDIPTVGVGEATIPQIRLFNQALGIDEDELIRATGATFKLGIEFAGWGAPDDRYMHAFGDIGRNSGMLAFHHLWLRGHRAGVARPLGDYALNAVAAKADRMRRGAPRPASMLPDMPYALHFDAALYAAFLRRRAQAGGVTRVEGRIVDVVRDGKSGDVAALTLAGDRRVDGDLFVDCTGFRALLIGGALGVGYEEWTRWLPCDRAMAVASAPVAQAGPYTRAIAHDAGWQWRIPLQHRTGNGIVYSSRHLDDAAAAERLLANLDSAPLGDPRPLRFATGRRRAAWHANVVAMGLSSGFLEPLESTSIHMIQSAIERLVTLLPGRAIAPALRDEYNRRTAFEAERIRDFIILHYIANRRDAPFWRERRDGDIPDTLRAKLELWRGAARILRDRDELFTEAGWLQVLVGQGVIPAAHHPMADAPTPAQLAEFLDILPRLNLREVAQMPRHDDIIARHCAAPAGLAA